MKLKTLIAIVLFTTLLATIGLIYSSAAPTVDANATFNIGETAAELELPYANEDSIDQDNYRQNFADLIGSLLSVVMAIAMLSLLLMLVWGGLEWITAGGDKSKLESARSRIMQSIIGVVVLASAVAIFSLMQQILGVCVLNFGPYSCSGTSSSTSPTPGPVPSPPPPVTPGLPG